MTILMIIIELHLSTGSGSIRTFRSASDTTGLIEFVCFDVSNGKCKCFLNSVNRISQCCRSGGAVNAVAAPHMSPFQRRLAPNEWVVIYFSYWMNLNLSFERICEDSRLCRSEEYVTHEFTAPTILFKCY